MEWFPLDSQTGSDPNKALPCFSTHSVLHPLSLFIFFVFFIFHSLFRIFPSSSPLNPHSFSLWGILHHAGSESIGGWGATRAMIKQLVLFPEHGIRDGFSFFSLLLSCPLVRLLLKLPLSFLFSFFFLWGRGASFIWSVDCLRSRCRIPLREKAGGSKGRADEAAGIGASLSARRRHGWLLGGGYRKCRSGMM